MSEVGFGKTGVLEILGEVSGHGHRADESGQAPRVGRVDCERSADSAVGSITLPPTKKQGR